MSLPSSATPAWSSALSASGTATPGGGTRRTLSTWLSRSPSAAAAATRRSDSESARIVIIPPVRGGDCSIVCLSNAAFSDGVAMNRGKLLELWRSKVDAGTSVKGGPQGPDFVVVSNADKLAVKVALPVAALLPLGDA